MAIVIKSPEELEVMAEVGRLHTEIFAELESQIRPGVSTLELEHWVRRAIQARGGTAPQIGYQGYPYATCMSLGEVVVHGFPSERPLQEGDLLKVDFAFGYRGFVTDMARTYLVGGRGSEEAEALIRATEEAFWAGFDRMRPGTRIGDVSAAVQASLEARGYWVVREMVGHGVGRSMHEDPQVPNFGRPGTGPRLRAGMTLALEPMVTLYPASVVILSDGWTASSGRGNLAAHYENTVAVTEEGPRLLTGALKERLSAPTSR